MTSKNNNKTTNADHLPALRIGSRVRYRDDGVAGRIVWANAVALKIEWDDGEQVTWRRDSLSERPIDILDAGDEEQPAAMTDAAMEVEQSAPIDAPPVQPATATPDWQTLRNYDHAEDLAEALFEVQSTALAIAEEEATRVKAATVAEPIANVKSRMPTTVKEKNRSALDAAALVLAEEGKPMNCQELIATMATRGYWSSPKGRTPASTLYSALAREISVKGNAGRFVKAERGKFGLANVV